MDKSIYDYRGKGVYTVAGRKTVLNIKNLKLYHCPPKDESTRKPHPATIPTSKKVIPMGNRNISRNPLFMELLAVYLALE
jgi:hypothetical protein